MKKLLFVFILVFAVCCSGTAEAKTVKFVAESLTSILSEDESIKYATLKLIADTQIEDVVLEKDSMLRIKIVRVQNARRAKMNAYLMGELLAYSKPSEKNKTYDISSSKYECKIKTYSPADFKGMAQSAAVSAAGHVLNVPLVPQGVAAVKGAIHPIEGKSRLKSAAIGVYQSTPFSYIEKGEELNVKSGDLLTVAVKINSGEADDTDEDELVQDKADIKLQSSGHTSLDDLNTKIHNRLQSGTPVHAYPDPQPRILPSEEE